MESIDIIGFLIFWIFICIAGAVLFSYNEKRKENKEREQEVKYKILEIKLDNLENIADLSEEDLKYIHYFIYKTSSGMYLLQHMKNNDLALKLLLKIQNLN